MKGWRDDLMHAVITALIFLSFFVLCLCVAMANQAGFFAFSEGNSTVRTNRESTMTVEQTGRTVFTATENVSEALR